MLHDYRRKKKDDKSYRYKTYRLESFSPLIEIKLVIVTTYIHRKKKKNEL